MSQKRIARFSAFTLTILAACLLPRWSTGQTPAPPVSASPRFPAEEVRRLITALDGPTLSEREAAERRLMLMGPDILPLLPQVDDQLSAETRLRLQRIRRMAEGRWASQRLGESKVSLHAQGESLGNLLDEIASQTGNAVNAQPPALVTEMLDVSFDVMPFWQAMGQLADALDAELRPAADAKAVVVTYPKPEASRRLSSWQGPFRFVLTEMNRQPTAGKVALTLELQWEPRIRLIRMVAPLDAIEAQDENGRRLTATNPTAVLEIPCGGDSVSRSIRLNVAPAPVADASVTEISHIASLKGEVEVLAYGPVRPFSLPLSAESARRKRRIGGATVEVDSVRRSKDEWEVELSLRYDEAHGAFASHQTWFYDNAVFLSGGKEHRILPSNQRVIRQYEDGVRLAYSFRTSASLSELQLTYETPIALLSRRVSFRIEE